MKKSFLKNEKFLKKSLLSSYSSKQINEKLLKKSFICFSISILINHITFIIENDEIFQRIIYTKIVKNKRILINIIRQNYIKLKLKNCKIKNK